VVDNVLAKLPNLRAQIPPSVKIDVTMEPLAVDPPVRQRRRGDPADRHRAGDPRDLSVPASASATFIPALAVPISLCGTFAAMYMLDFSINNMTLLALTCRRVRGRRRHRDAGKHRPPYRKRHASV